MARITYLLRADTRGMEPLMVMVRSLAEALGQIDAAPDFELGNRSGDNGGLTFNGQLIASVTAGDPVNEPDAVAVPLTARPTVFLPLFASAIVRQFPAVKVAWVDGWPRFTASPRDSDGEDDPLPTAPILEPLNA